MGNTPGRLVERRRKLTVSGNDIRSSELEEERRREGRARSYSIPLTPSPQHALDAVVQKATRQHQLHHQEKEEQLRLQQQKHKTTPPIVYRNQGTDILSNMLDHKEWDKLQRQHYLMKSVRKSNAWAPLEDPRVILDVGSGNGIWAYEMALEYPQTKVIGMDVRAPTHLSQDALPNLHHTHADVTKPWPIESASVDFVYQRHMSHDLNTDEWKHVLREMKRVLRPGGFIELLEREHEHRSGGPMQVEMDATYQVYCHQHGFEYNFTRAMSTWITEAGLDLQQERTFEIPIGEWSSDAELKKLGFINKEVVKSLLRIHSHDITDTWDIPNEEYEKHIHMFINECEDHHSFTRYFCWIVVKPELQTE